MSPLNSTQAKRLSLVLGLSMLFVGVCGLSYEYSFSKLASDVLGNATKQWALVIGVMMLFMGLGADLQKYLSDQNLVDRFIGLEILLGIVGGWGITLSWYVFGQWHDAFVLVHYGLIALVGLLIGLEIPLLTRVNETCLPSLKENLGMILKMDYIGSFLGALIWVYLLTKYFNLLEITYLLGLINLAVALAALWFFRDFVKYPRRLAMLGGLAMLALGIGFWQGEPLRLALEQRLFKDPIILAKTTPYQRILLTKNLRGELDCYINGHLQFSSRDEWIYHEFLVHPALRAIENPKRVLVLGGGDGLAVREILKYPSIEQIDLVDLDPAMTDLAQTQPDLVKLNQGAFQNAKTKLLASQGVSPGESYLLE